MSSTTSSRRSRRRFAMAAAAGIAASAMATGLAATAASASTTSTGFAYPPCNSSELQVTWHNNPGGGTPGSYYSTIDFANTGRFTCAMYGYPGVAMLTASGGQIGAAATHAANPTPRDVLIAPGAEAHATLRTRDATAYPATTCRPTHASWLRITPPVDSAKATRVAHPSTGCANSAVKVLSVSNVNPGR